MAMKRFLIESDAGFLCSAFEEPTENFNCVNDPTEVEPQGETYEESPKFVERPALGTDDCEYRRSGTDAGLVVIFNQRYFNDKDIKERCGTDRDVDELILTFGRLGYNIQPRYVFQDLTREKILDNLGKISGEDHSERNSLIIIVLTHGNANDMIMARDDSLETHEIWEPFSSSKCKTLENKPKFFIFQACKGEYYSNRNNVLGDVVPTTAFTTLIEPDMLLAFSAVEGSQSYRHSLYGSWFVQELCRNFSAYGRRDDVLSLLIRTTKCVANDHYHDGPDEKRRAPIRKQMPLFISTLTKRFYLTKSKDRNLLLDILKRQQMIAAGLDEVKKKIDVMSANGDEKMAIAK